MDYKHNRGRAPAAKKTIRRHGKDFYRLIGAKGWEVRREMMLGRAGRYVRED